MMKLLPPPLGKFLKLTEKFGVVFSCFHKIWTGQSDRNLH